MNALKPLRRKNGHECLFCGSKKSTYRIHTDNLGYDEVSCSKHSRNLEAHADDTLGEYTVQRWHITSSAGVCRGDKPMVDRISTTTPTLARESHGMAATVLEGTAPNPVQVNAEANVAYPIAGINEGRDSRRDGLSRCRKARYGSPSRGRNF